ncbi:hypothetical protein [Streptomyces sp. NPDC057702]|uniref:hypothetical protein n=1 Tax=unclassified Streptomyces TaxID=2593676 RepID=UPI00368CC6B3
MFEPVRVRRARWHRLHRVLRKRRRVAALGLVATAVLAAAIAASPAGDERAGGSSPATPRPEANTPPRVADVRAPGASSPPSDSPGPASGVRQGSPADLRAAPVRIADAGVVRLLRRGDLVDVLAAEPAADWAGQPVTGPETGPRDTADGPAGSPAGDGSPEAEGAAPDRPARRAGSARDASVGPRLVARAARVVDVPRPHETAPGDGALVVLSVPRETATTLVSAGLTARLAVVQR